MLDNFELHLIIILCSWVLESTAHQNMLFLGQSSQVLLQVQALVELVSMQKPYTVDNVM